MDLIKDYSSSFTPEGSLEIPKKCPDCEKMLPAAKFRMKSGSRDGVKGILRNRRCRRCESERDAIEFEQQKDVLRKKTEELESSFHEIKSKLDEALRSNADLQIVVSSFAAKFFKLEMEVENLKSKG